MFVSSLVAVLVSVVPAALAGGPPGCLLPPVTAPVSDPFRDPGCPWCPGNRGLQYDVPSGTAVRAAAAGTVTFSGSVAGTLYVVVEHSDGLRATYGGLSATSLAASDVVVAGAVVGRSGDGLHFGIRRGEDYIDPAPLLGRLVERPYLVPTDGTRRRPPPPPRFECPASHSRPTPAAATGSGVPA